MNNGGSITLNNYGSHSTLGGGFGGMFVDTTGSVTGDVQLSGGGSSSFSFNQMNGTLNGSLRMYYTSGYTFNGTQAAAGKRLDLHNSSSMTLNGTFNATGGVQVDSASALTIDGNERLSVGTTGVLQLAGGTFAFANSGGGAITQTFATNGALSLTNSLGYSAASAITVAANTTLSFGTAGGNAALAAGAATGPGMLSINPGSAGGTVQFFNTPLTNGLIGGGIIHRGTSIEWATLSGNNVVGLTTYETSTNSNDWAATENVKMSGTNVAITTTSRTINSLHMSGVATTGRTLTISAGNTLTLGTGGVIGIVNGIGNISGGTLTVNTATAGNYLRFTLDRITMNVSSVIANQGGNTVGLVLSSNSTLNLTGANTFTGDVYIHGGTLGITAANNLGAGTRVNISNGTLRVDSAMTLSKQIDVGTGFGTIAPPASGALTLSAANPILGTNRGTFTVSGNSGTVRGGTITAGTGIGASTLTVASNGLTLEGGQYLVKLYGTGYTNSSTTDISKLNVTGNVTISRTSLIRLDLTAISAADVTTMRAGGSRVYNVIEGTGSVSNFQAGNFSILSLGQFMAGEWTFLTSPTSGTVQLNFTPVPEPASVLAFGALGLAAVGGLRRLRRK